MILRLKNANASQFPPAGWNFLDPKTGFKCVGHEGTPAMHAAKIIANRRANPHIYPASETAAFDTQSVIQEIYQQKFVTHPGLFVGFDQPPRVRAVPEGAKVIVGNNACSCGSLEFIEELCKTCGGRKVVGWKCSKCGKRKK